ncbi:MAG: class I SAM-dependent methyltransferase [bacterium]|nr:class I SAM-dependent methyltransferase [bacterium]
MSQQEQPSNANASWSDYYQATKDNPPHALVLKALELFEAEPAKGERFAIDLGCGAGRDTRELLRRGWRVLAVDQEEGALEALLKLTPPEHLPRIQTQAMAFESLVIPQADLINASFSLPFCKPESFDGLWATMLQALRPGGRFAGNFFGVRDQWANSPAMTFHSQAQVRTMLDSLETEFFEEIEQEGPTACRGSKHWHLFSVVARRPA